MVPRECKYAKQIMNYSALYILGVTCRLNDLSVFTFVMLYYFINVVFPQWFALGKYIQ